MQYQRKSKAFANELRLIVAVAVSALFLPIGVSPAFAEDFEPGSEQQQTMQQMSLESEGDAATTSSEAAEPEGTNQDASDSDAEAPDVENSGEVNGVENPSDENPADENPAEENLNGDELNADELNDNELSGDEFNDEEELNEAPELKARDITPMAVGKTTIVITKVGDRTGAGMTDGAPLSGVTFNAYASSSSSTPPTGGTSIGSCTTDGSGKCSIVVENNYPNGVWIKETAWPAGWLPIDYLGTGAYQNSKTATPYMFRVEVGTGSSNATKNVTTDTNAPSQQKSGVWVNARVNPPFPQKCGVSIAMVFDTSASINATEMTQFKDAAKKFVGTDALGGTPSQATMFRFDTVAQTMNGGAAFNLAVPGTVGGNVGYQGAITAINSLPSSGNSSGYTNWDAALRLVKATGDFDMVLFLTDGDPTTHGLSGTDRNTNVQFRMVEQAVMSANALKTEIGPSGQYTKIVGVGVGMTSNSHYNLQAITGPALGQDYFLSSNFATLETTLQEIATKNCASTLSVVKQIQNSAGELISSSASGWSFTAAGPVFSGGSATQITSSSGTNFGMVFPTANSETVTVTETLQSGYSFVSASCTNAAGVVEQTTNGFTVVVSSNLITTCTVINREVPQDVDVVASKTWVVTDLSGNVLRTAHLPEETTDDDLPPGLSANLFIYKTGATTQTPREWGETVDEFKQGDSVTVSENTAVDTLLSPGCQLVSQTVTSVNGIALETPATLPYEETLSVDGLNVGITNTVECGTELTLLKSVEGGTAEPNGWNLIATSQAAGGSGTHTVPGSSTANAANTFQVVAGDGYLLSEELAASNQSLAYRLDRVEKCVLSNGTCVWTAFDPASQVSIALGAHETFRFVNIPMPLLTMPLSGGFGADWFVLTGISTMMFASFIAFLAWRRSRRPSTYLR